MIRLENIKKVYNTGTVIVNALNSISLEIKKNEFVSIMGSSGSGKSTLMHLLGCLDIPTSGKYYLDNIDVSLLKSNKLAYTRNKKIGFIFQNFNLMSKMSAIKNIEMPLIYADIGGTERKEKAMYALSRVGLEHRALHKPTELSGGERQRIAIARSLVNDPYLILADEPTGNLDSTTSKEIMDIFRTLHKEGTTIIMVTHESDIAAYADRLIHIKDGAVCETIIIE